MRLICNRKKESNYRKKTICLLACVLVLMCAFCACGKAEVAPDSDSLQVVTSAPTPTPTPTPDVIPIVGTVDGLSYENASFGFGALFPEDWIVADRSVLARIAGIEVSTTEGPEYDEAMLGAPYYFELYAQGPNNERVNVTVEKLVEPISREDYVQFAVAQLPEAMENAGMKNVSSIVVQSAIMGQEQTAILTSAEVDGVPYFSLQTFYPIADRMVIISRTCFTENSTESFGNFFYRIPAGE